MFREANERIAARADELGLERGIPFLCECSDTRCMRMVRLDLRGYKDVRADPAHYLSIPGHAIPGAQVIEESGALAILEKTAD